MRNLTKLVVALAWLLVAPPLSAFAQRELSPQGVGPAPHISPQGVGPAPNRGAARLAPTRLPSHNFAGRVYHGQLDWRRGRWHHATRNGQFGWWWDVGGVWYFYPEPIEGPPAYVSDIEVADDATVDPAPPPQQPHYAFYYRPGDLKGIAYQTIEDCSQARQQAGNIGVCVMK
jgi:hypothetical protein